MKVESSGLFYTLQSPGGQVSTILYCQWTGTAWSGPEIAPFAGRYSDLEPAFSYDGNTLFFASNRPVKGAEPGSPTVGSTTLGAHAGVAKDFDIWMVKREQGRWGQPTRLANATTGVALWTADVRDAEGHLTK